MGPSVLSNCFLYDVTAASTGHRQGLGYYPAMLRGSGSGSGYDSERKQRKVSPPWGKNQTLPPFGVVLDGLGHRQGLGHELHFTFIAGVRGRGIGGRCRGRGGR